jgi:hypothetical protein
MTESYDCIIELIHLLPLANKISGEGQSVLSFAIAFHRYAVVIYTNYLPPLLTEWLFILRTKYTIQNIKDTL